MSETSYTDFYPTPKPLIKKMLDGLNLKTINCFLEPSAGKGDICDYIIKAINDSRYEGRYGYHRSETEIDVIEVNPDLQFLLKGKYDKGNENSRELNANVRLVHDDFLTFKTRKPYGCIVANFPFSEGDKHLNQALDLLEVHGGELRCLVNAETLRNPYTTLRRALSLRLASLNAEIDYLTGEFESAERKTSVEVALIKAKVEPPEAFSFILDGLKKSAPVEIETAPVTDIASSNFLESVVAQFDFECSAGIRLLTEYYALAPHILDRLPSPVSGHDYSKPLLSIQVDERSSRDSLAGDVNAYLRGVRHKYWEGLIQNPIFNGQCTSNILKELSAKLTELKDYDFTLFNIAELQKDILAKLSKGVEEAILALFDKCSRQHSYWRDEVSESENIWMYNGWKTNKAWKINKKIILPLHGIRPDWSGRDYKFDYNTPNELTDMVKVFNYLSRDKVSAPQLVGNAVARADHAGNFDIDLRYFRMKFFKKGTCHIWFNDQELLDKFNIFGSQRKGWLPPSYGHKSYNEMSQEERRTVDDFQGKAEYERVMRNKAFYLVDSKQLARLASGEPLEPEQVSEPEPKIEPAPPKAQERASSKQFKPATPRPAQDIDSVLEKMEQMVNGRLF